MLPHAPETLVRATQSVCPTCVKPLDARVVESDGAVYLRKECPEHGPSECLLSRHPWYYAGLDRYYFAIMDREWPQRDYMVRMTEKCNLQCPICLAAATPQVQPPATPDFDVDRLDAFFDAHPGQRFKIDLISAEPTLRADLPDVMRHIKSRGHIVALHTNGIRLANRAYLKELRDAGMDEVHLQMDGFDDEAYMKLRGARLTKNKQQVLDNLEALDVATDLVMVIMPRANEDEIPRVLDYCRDKTFVRELFLLGTRPLGYFRESEDLLMPDQVIDLLGARSGGLVRRRDVFRFQKLYFALLSLLGVRKCLYVQHYLLVRDRRRDWIPVAELFDWAGIERVLDELPRLQGAPTWRRALWAVRLLWRLADRRAFRFALDFAGLALHLKFGWNLGGLPRRVLMLGFITACDPHNVDYEVTVNCGKGEISMDEGVHPSSAHANIDRERGWR